MSKLLSELCKKIQQGKTLAVKNGRMVERDYGYTYTGDLIEQWAIERIGYNQFELRHWGTSLIVFNILDMYYSNYEIESLYAESKSDIDGINFVANYFNIPLHAHYYPSRCEAEFHNNDDDSLVKKI